MNIYCPLCNRIDVGRVGANQYFCWNCCVEFKETKEQNYQIYNIEDDGTLTSVYKI
ncbi:hypothetical protein [Natranaerobius trueperi]|uniref:hypothetical protein n=1 Tax=Natranaerobius trueperi TaxID=759412 RepID=UPI00146C7F71|nr:hypothetical protein [Natranaerobius trueperi]